MTFALITAGVFAVSFIAIVILLAVSLRRALNETDEWCGMVDDELSFRTKAGGGFRVADFHLVSRVVPRDYVEVFFDGDDIAFEWPERTA